MTHADALRVAHELHRIGDGVLFIVMWLAVIAILYIMKP